MIYQLASVLFPSIVWSHPAQPPVVYLTFDDGPHPEFTIQVVRILEQFKVKATFFMVGQKVEQYPDVVRAVALSGLGIGMHGYTHQYMTLLSNSKHRQHLLKTQSAIQFVTGHPPTLFRPPYGGFAPGLIRLCRHLSITPVMWTNMPFDFESRWSDEQVISNAVKRTRNGTIIVLHDGHPLSNRTVRILPEIIERLRKRGFDLTQPL
ncbi:polysaccharide deacetylase family protein [candidate division KSB1 bacterium]|nr:polysaccharide deacetylase family protein [candidate division KSB1 bacterium]